LLSDRELEVFRYIGQGLRPKDIAEAMGLSVRTVESYRVHIREKFNLKTAGELSKVAIEWCKESR
jgi:DNA-binding CsgD family transcriptional regulator